MSVGSPQDHRLTLSGRLRKAARSRPLRRLVIALVALLAADRFEPALLRSLEEARYEDPARDFRFENSDLFGLGPMVAYLREHPHGRGRRVIFLGNSFTYGYLLTAADALPGRYQRFDTSAKVFNVGINGFEPSSSFLVAKAVIDSVDMVYALNFYPSPANPMLPKLIPIEEADLAEFQLAAPNAAERRLSQAVNHWRLYRDAYRLQAGLFGTSTRQYLYLNKGAFVRALIARVRAAEADSAPDDDTVRIDAPMAGTMPDAGRQALLRAQIPDLCRFADLVVSRRKTVVFLHVPVYSGDLADDTAADFNRAFAPYARVLVLHLPRRLTTDGLHLTSAGAAAVARALWDERTAGHP